MTDHSPPRSGSLPRLKYLPFQAQSKSFSPRPFRPTRRRHLTLIAVVSLALFYYFYWRVDLDNTSSHYDHPSGLHRELEHYMNDDLQSEQIPIVKSSFDWSRVSFRYSPAPTRPLPSGRPLSLAPIQHKFGKEANSGTKTREIRRDEVKALFVKNWKSYRKYAWKKDVLQPLSATSRDQFSGWAATLVDSLDTLWLMGMREEFNEAVGAVSEIDFGQSSSSRVNSFETTIRCLGGFLSAYDLSKRDVLLQKAVELGDLLYSGFNTPNRMPVDFIDFARAKTGEGLEAEGSVVSASPGTLSMEMAHLSQLTGDPKYYDAAFRVMDVFYRDQNNTKLPGMWPIYVPMRSQDVVSGNQFTLAGCADSLYEYLPKLYALLGGLDAQRYGTMAQVSLDAADALLFRPMLPSEEDIPISGNVNVLGSGQISLDPESEHLACFAGGMYALAGRLFNRPSYVSTGIKLTHGCVYTYQAMPTGMGPERWNMVACPSRDKCKWDEDIWVDGRRKRPQWKEHLPKGFTTAKDPRYILRPEAIESVFMLYRITGLQEYQDAAWDMFQAISKGTYTPFANAAVLDVTLLSGPLP